MQLSTLTHRDEPPQLWIEKLEFAPASGGSTQRKRPTVVVEVAGKALNGVDVSRVIVDFKQAFQGDPGMAGLDPQMSRIEGQDKAERVRITVAEKETP